MLRRCSRNVKIAGPRGTIETNIKGSFRHESRFRAASRPTEQETVNKQAFVYARFVMERRDCSDEEDVRVMEIGLVSRVSSPLYCMTMT